MSRAYGIRLTEVRFLQPGIDFRGQTKFQLTTRLDRVEMRVTEGWIEVHDLESKVTTAYPPSLVRQTVVFRTALACPECGELFKSTGGMGNHLRLKHPEPRPTPVKPPKAERKLRTVSNG